ncbi:MAG: hypothetical protein JRF69_00005, partial [Deltaproteobacteria bacterium]|nr:hypothetical protein [Deltaproteobacteria bacterium]
MYLAQRTIKGKRHYFIRESYKKDGDLFRSRELFGLGTNLAKYVIYPGGRAFYIDEVVEDSLSSLGVTPGVDEIEDVFWPFIKPEVRRVIEPYRHRGKGGKITPEEQEQICIWASEFDKRRIHYLRSGRMDQGGLGRMHLKLYVWLSA